LSTKKISIGRLVGFQALILVLSGMVRLALCAQAGTATVLLDVPAIKQPYNLCLAACVSMVLKYWGVDVTPQAIADQVPLYRDGVTGQDLQRVVEQIGFRGFLVQPPFEDLLEHLKKGRPPVVSFLSRGKSRHAMVLVGIDAGKQDVFLIDPASGKRRSLDYRTFQHKWESAQRWTFLIVPR
jgi:ABC-type bacteriocin/lantibiotic exporter with double-glycine peptidase domain